ncbi:uncharacterized protein LOC120337811 isoform X2 [Styela clava]
MRSEIFGISLKIKRVHPSHPTLEMKSSSTYPSYSNVAEKILLFESKSSLETTFNNKEDIVYQKYTTFSSETVSTSTLRLSNGVLNPKLACDFSFADRSSSFSNFVENFDEESTYERRVMTGTINVKIARSNQLEQNNRAARNANGFADALDESSDSSREEGDDEEISLDDARKYSPDTRSSIVCKMTNRSPNRSSGYAPFYEDSYSSTDQDEVVQESMVFRKKHQSEATLLQKYQDRLNNNEDEERVSNYSNSPEETDDNKSPNDDVYDSDSSTEFLYCREKCVRHFGPDSIDDTNSSHSESLHENQFSSDKSSTSCTSGSESSICANQYGSVKRSSNAFSDDDDDLLRSRESCIKRFRSNEGLAVTPPDSDANLEYAQYLSGSDDSPLGASSCTTESTVYYASSPIVGQEAEYGNVGYPLGQIANLPLNSDNSLTHAHVHGAHADHPTAGKDYGVEDDNVYYRSPEYQDTKDFLDLFHDPDTILPFQLHPIHTEDMVQYYNFMCEKELVSHPSHCLRGQPNIKHSMRSILVEWLTKISHHYKFNGQSLHLTINILDRYTERQKRIYRGHYQLLGVTSLLVATKQLEVDIPPVTTCLMLCRNLYSKTQLLSLERHLLDILEFDLNVPTAHSFLDYYVISRYEQNSDRRQIGTFGDWQAQRCKSRPPSYLKKLLCISRCLLDYGLADYNFSQFIPSIAARAAMTIAENILEDAISSTFWPRPYRYLDSVDSRFIDGLARSQEFYHRRTSAKTANDSSQLFSRGISEEDFTEEGDIRVCVGVLRDVVGDDKIAHIQETLDNVVKRTVLLSI